MPVSEIVKFPAFTHDVLEVYVDVPTTERANFWFVWLTICINLVSAFLAFSIKDTPQRNALQNPVRIYPAVRASWYDIHQPRFCNFYGYRRNTHMQTLRTANMKLRSCSRGLNSIYFKFGCPPVCHGYTDIL